ncbi:MAG: dienelactone hydrolase family protein [Polyangiaceae bacterium]
MRSGLVQGVRTLLLLGLIMVAGCSSKGCASKLVGSSLSPGVMTSLSITGDKPIDVIRAPSGVKRVVVYLHGRCEKTDITNKEWTAEASKVAHLILLQGDTACAGTAYHEWTRDVAVVDARVEAAVAALAAAIPGQVDTSALIIAGYSEGAKRVSSLGARRPDRYNRAIMIGAPEAPTTAELGKAKAVVTMAGEKDRHDLMLQGVSTLSAAKVPAKFMVLPGTDHGFFGPQGGRVMREAIEWISATAP